ncbi:MAG TPA: serine protease [Verrucomicrobiae bacterium]
MLVWVSAAVGWESPPAAAPAGWLENVRPALAVLVSCDRQARWKSFGTGFFITGDGILVTARHVAQAQENLVAITHDGRRHKVTRFLGDDPDYDIAVLQIDGADFATLRTATTLPATNDWVALVSPTDQWSELFRHTNLPPVCATGEVASLLVLPGVWLAITTTVPAQPGQSGSPLLNQAGEVIGLVPYTSAEQQATASPIAIAQAIASRAAGAGGVPFQQRPKKGGSLPLTMDADFRAGCAAISREDWVEAERRMKRAARHFRASPVPLAVLGTVCAKRAAWKQVHGYCTKALRLQPRGAFCALLDGSSLVMLGRLAEGTAAVRKSLDLGLPNGALQASAWALLASTETALGRHDQAQFALDNLQRLDAAEAAKLRSRLQLETRVPEAKTE